MGRPSSGVSLAFFTASWNFFSSRLALFFSASTAWRKSDSLRPSCSRMALAAASKSLNVLGLTAATCEITALVSGSTFSVAEQHGQATSKGSWEDFAIRRLYARGRGEPRLDGFAGILLVAGFHDPFEQGYLAHNSHSLQNVNPGSMYAGNIRIPQPPKCDCQRQKYNQAAENAEKLKNGLHLRG